MKKSGPTLSWREGLDPLFPLCDGQPMLTIEPDSPHFPVKLKFLRFYHRINRALAQALAAKGNRAKDNLVDRLITHPERLQRALQAKQKFESEWATRGLLVIPKRKGGFTVNVCFQTPPPQPRRPRDIVSSCFQSMEVRLPRRPRAAL